MRARGFTLVELVMAIVVVSIAVGGVLLAIRTMVVRSADPMIAQQGIAVAEAYLEEILTKNFTGNSPVCTSRPVFNAADCYFGNAWTPPDDQGGNPIAALAGYTVTVAGNAGTPCGFGAGAGEQLVTVTVSHTSGFSYQLHGCMTDY